MYTRRAILLTATSAVAFMAAYARAQQEKPNVWVGLEGTSREEKPSGDPKATELWLYTDRMSYAPGDEVIFRVHCTTPTFDVRIHRDGANEEVVWEKAKLDGSPQETPANAYEIGCGWNESFRISIPTDWRSGVYVITAQATADGGETVTGEHMIVVRASTPGQNRMVMVLCTGTYVAYNDWGGANSYRTENEMVPSSRLSLQRPWARGFVNLPESAPRHGSSRNLKPFEKPRFPPLEWALTHRLSRHYVDSGWASYEKRFTKWAEGEGYSYDYLTGHDLDENIEALDAYDVVLLVGHDEYWSSRMRDALDRFQDKGGNLVRFCGNWIWQVRIEDGGKTQVCYKAADFDPLAGSGQDHLVTTLWDHPVVNRPASPVIGLNGIWGIYNLLGGASPRGHGGLTVYRNKHWVFEGTDLYFGDVIGMHPTSIATYEGDGIDFTFRNGLPEPTLLDGAPEDTVILAMTSAIKGEEDHTGEGRMQLAPLAEFEHGAESLVKANDLLPEGQHRFVVGEGPLSLYGSLAMVVCSVGEGEVFSCGLPCWVYGLEDRDFFVEQITRNVLNRFLS